VKGSGLCNGIALNPTWFILRLAARFPSSIEQEITEATEKKWLCLLRLLLLAFVKRLGPNLGFWSAVAERSGDTAFARTGGKQTGEIFRQHQSGVALRFPPQSKNLIAARPRCASALNSTGFFPSETR
jgi:hypothetical protein